jgi:hypothetical protein
MPVTWCAASLGLQAGEDSADGVAVLWVSVRGLLLFDVLAHDGNRRTTTT